MKRRFLSILLAALMLLSLLPATALAAGTETPDREAGYNGGELPDGPTMNSDVWTVTPENAQYTLDGAYGSINGKTIHFSAGTYEDVLVLARPTKYAGSNTLYYNMNWSQETGWVKEDNPIEYGSVEWSSITTYARTVSGVSFTADDGVELPGFSLASGHIHSNISPAYDYVRDTEISGTSNSHHAYCSLENVTFDGLTINGQVAFYDYSSDIQDFAGNTKIDSILFKNCTFQGDNDEDKMKDQAFAAIKMGADSQYFENVTVTGCTISDYFQGVYIQGTDSLTVTNCSINNTYHNAIAVQSGNNSEVRGNIVITENVIQNAGDRAIRFGSAPNVETITVNNNIMLDSGDTDGELIAATTLNQSALVSLEHNYWGENGSSGVIGNGFTAPTTTGVTGGTFSGLGDIAAYCAEGYVPTKNEDGSFTVAYDNSNIFAGGSGTADDPYQIANETQLAAFRDAVNNGVSYAGQYIELTADITLTGASWEPIGNSDREDKVENPGTKYFAGIFDGSGHTITGLSNGTYTPVSEAVSPDNEYLYGLFGYTHNAVLKNLNFADVQINTYHEETAVQGDGVAALVGYGSGALTVENVHILSGSIVGNDSVGGIVGRAYGTETTITNCSNAAGIEHKKDNGKAGGLVGTASSKTTKIVISASANTGTITGVHVGGIMGYIGSGPAESSFIFDRCTNSGIIIGTGYAGGITGYDSGNTKKTVTFQTCFNSGAVRGDTGAGGILGIGTAVKTRKFTDCVNTGSVTTTGENAGGILGSGQTSLIITNARVTGSVTISARDVAGGIVGSVGGSGTVLLDSCTVEDTVTLTTTNEDVTQNQNSTYDGVIRGVAAGKLDLDNNEVTIRNMSDYGGYELVAAVYCNSSAKPLILENCATSNSMDWMNNSATIPLTLKNSQLAGLVQNGRTLKITVADAADGTPSSVGELVAGAKYQYKEIYDKVTSGQTVTVAIAAGTTLTADYAEDFSITYSEKAYSGTIKGEDTTSFLKVTAGGIKPETTVDGATQTAKAAGLYQWNSESSSWDLVVAQVGGTYYTDLSTAIANAGTAPVELMANVSAAVSVNEAVVIRRNGFAITNLSAGGGYALSSTDDIYTIYQTASGETYTVVYEQEALTGGYTEIEKVSVSSGDLAAALQKTYEGFTIASTALSETTYTIQYTRNTYTVTWDVDGAVTSEDYKFGAAITQPTAPTKDGYTFAGWEGYTDGMTMPASDVTFTAQWTANTTPGGSSSPTRYTVSAPSDVEGGAITVSPSRASRGQTVTVTVTPDEGYELDSLTVTDSDGNALTLTDKGNGKYTFTMPRGAVSIAASFKAAEEPRPSGFPFTDVTAGDWYYDAVAYAWENELMTGTSATTFAPGMTTDRAMMTTLLWRLEGSPVVNYLLDFTDVAEGLWYSEAVRWAASEGVVNGVGDGSAFAPTGAITREQMAVMLYRYAQYKGYDVTGSADLSGYADAAGVSGWAQYAVQWAVDSGLISGVGNSALNPQGSATRAEIATILMRFIETFVPAE